MKEFARIIYFVLKHMLHIRNPLFDTSKNTVYTIKCFDGIREITFVIKDGELIE